MVDSMRFCVFGLLASVLKLLEPGAHVNVPLWPSVVEALKQNPRDDNAKVLSSFILFSLLKFFFLFLM